VDNLEQLGILASRICIQSFMTFEQLSEQIRNRNSLQFNKLSFKGFFCFSKTVNGWTIVRSFFSQSKKTRLFFSLFHRKNYSNIELKQASPLFQHRYLVASYCQFAKHSETNWLIFLLQVEVSGVQLITSSSKTRYEGVLQR